MAKRGQRATHRVRYVHANDIKGTIPVFAGLESARYAARAPLSRPGCEVSIEDAATGVVVEGYADLGQLELAILGSLPTLAQG